MVNILRWDKSMNYIKKQLVKINKWFSGWVMKNSYKKHLNLALKRKIPLAYGVTPHIAGLYGALSTRYIAAKIPQLEPFLWIELTPFLLMDEKESINALAEYVSCSRNPEDKQEEWLKRVINNALRKIQSANEDRRAMAVMALIYPTIYWRILLNQDVKGILQNEFLKMFSSKDEIAPEIYDLLDEELRTKINNLKS